MKWLITGGCGFIGTNAAIALSNSGEDIVVVDNLSRANVDRNLPRLRRLGVECHVADIRDQHAIGRILAQHADTDVVLHLAGQVSLVASIAEPFHDFDVNARGTLILLEEVRRQLPGAVVLYSSTNKVYGDLRHLRVTETPSRYLLPDRPNGITEIEPLDFHGGYGCSKGAADQYMLEYNRAYGLRTVVLRQSSVYGGNQYATADQGWIAYFVRMAVTGKPFAINGSGLQVRDGLHVDDLIRAFRACVEAIDQTRGRALNIGGGSTNAMSLVELFSLLQSRFGLSVSYTSGPERPSDQKVFVSDNSLISGLTGWKPEVAIEDGIESLVEWSRTEFAVPA